MEGFVFRPVEEKEFEPRPMEEPGEFTPHRIEYTVYFSKTHILKKRLLTREDKTVEITYFYEYEGKERPIVHTHWGSVQIPDNPKRKPAFFLLLL